MRTEEDHQKRQVREKRNTSWGTKWWPTTVTLRLCVLFVPVWYLPSYLKHAQNRKEAIVFIFILWWKRFPVFIHINAENISLAITAIIWEGIKTHHRLLALEKVLSTLKQRKEELLGTKYTHCLPGVWGVKHYKNSLKWWSTGQVSGWQ